MKKLIVITIAVLLITACSRATTPTVLPPVVQPSTIPGAGGAGPSEAQVYLQAAQAALTSYSAAVTALDARIDMFQVNQKWLNDAAWKAETMQILDDLQAAGEAFKSLPAVPAELAEFNTILQSIADETAAYVEDMKTGLNNMDVNGIDRARIHRKTIGEYMDNAQTKLSELLSTTP